MKWMEKYLLLANQQCGKMNLFHNECCFQWDLECLIKSNQIKSYFPISHIPYNRESNYNFPEFWWVKEDLNNYHHNTIQISFHFNLLFMINVLSKLSWPLIIVLQLTRSSPIRAHLPLNEMVCSFGRSRMRNEMKMNNHHILSNTAIWLKKMNLLQKKHFLMMEDLKHHFHFHSNHVSFFRFTHSNKGKR